MTGNFVGHVFVYVSTSTLHNNKLNVMDQLKKIHSMKVDRVIEYGTAGFRTR